VTEFNKLWKEITRREGVITVQNCEELEHVYNLMCDCETYLEVGTAEGNSLYVLAQALGKNSKWEVTPIVYYVDFGEKHTTPARDEVVRYLKDKGIQVKSCLGNSHHPDVVALPQADLSMYDVVLIDAGHSYEDALADAAAYGWRAKKYIIFHDVQLPEVRRAYDWYRAQMPEKESYRVVNSETFGYGVIKI